MSSSGPSDSVANARLPESNSTPVEDLNCFMPTAPSNLDPLVRNKWEGRDLQNGCRMVKAIVDSGASNSVASGSLAPDIEATPSEGSRRGHGYRWRSRGTQLLRE